MSKADVWMPLYIGDYLADTSRLTTEQHGAYMLLIMDYWRNGPPPDNDVVLAQITRMSLDAWSNARSTLQAFFKHEGGLWHHARIDREMAEAVDSKAKAKAKAEAAAAKRWGKDAPSNACSTPKAMHEECPSPSPSPIKTKTKSKDADKPLSFDPLSIELPANVPADVWQTWVRFRKKFKKQMQEDSWRGQVANLDLWASQGFSPHSIIKHSIDNGYQGLFEPKKQGGNGNGNHSADVVAAFTGSGGGRREPAPQGQTFDGEFRRTAG